jgi:serine/threonine protein kinase
VRKREESCDGYDMTGTTGSLRYMAPEVALRQVYCEKVDVYSYGIMLWHMASDKIPFKGLSREEFMTRVVVGGERPKIGLLWPKRFINLLQSCWHAESKMRPSFEVVLEQIEKMMGSA